MTLSAIKTGETSPAAGLPTGSEQDNLDPDVVAFVQAYARYAADREYEKQMKAHALLRLH